MFYIEAGFRRVSGPNLGGPNLGGPNLGGPATGGSSAGGPSAGADQKSFFERLVQSIPESKRKHAVLFKNRNVKALFYNCRKIELESHTVFISGRVFPKNKKPLEAALKEMISCGSESSMKETADAFLDGNFNLIGFPKNPSLARRGFPKQPAAFSAEDVARDARSRPVANRLSPPGFSAPETPAPALLFFILSDRHGTIPCFFKKAVSDEPTVVSSMLPWLLQGPWRRQWNEESLMDFLCLGYVFPQKSLWDFIGILPASQILTVQADGRLIFGQKKSRSLSTALESTALESAAPLASTALAASAPFRSLKECASVFFEFLRETMADLHCSGTRFMCLTGGSDTRMLLACMTNEYRESLIFRTRRAPETEEDVSAARLLAEALDLRHEEHCRNKQDEGESAFPPAISKIIKYQYFRDPHFNWITGNFGSALFGGGMLVDSLGLQYRFSENPAPLRSALLKTVVTQKDFSRIGSPFDRLKEGTFCMDSLNKEGAFLQEILIRSQFTSINVFFDDETCTIPSRNHAVGAVAPFSDTRIIDVFLSAPREYLLNYSLYEYVFTHFANKKLTKIPFHSNMTNFVENLPKLEKAGKTTRPTKQGFDYAEYFDRRFSPSLFEGTFLSRLSSAEGKDLPEPFLSRIGLLVGLSLSLKGASPPPRL